MRSETFELAPIGGSPILSHGCLRNLHCEIILCNPVEAARIDYRRVLCLADYGINAGTTTKGTCLNDLDILMEYNSLKSGAAREQIARNCNDIGRDFYNSTESPASGENIRTERNKFRR